MTTIYIATDGTGNYNTDGVDDQIEINNAIMQAAINDIIHLKIGTYIISDTVILKSNITLEGEGWNSIIKLKDNAGWWQSGKPIVGNSIGTLCTNFTAKNFKIDGNKQNQSEPGGQGYYNALNLQPAQNILLQGLWVGNNRNDGIRTNNGDWDRNASMNLLVENCYVYECEHSGIYMIYSNDSIIRNNKIGIRANSGIRYYGSTNMLMEHNEIYGTNSGDFGIQINHNGNNIMDNVIIIGNKIYDAPQAGIDLWSDYPSIDVAKNVIIKNNLIYHCGSNSYPDPKGGISICNFTDTYIENNTIFNNNGDGITFNSLSPIVRHMNVYVKNNIISNNKYGLNTAGYDATIYSNYNDIWSNLSGNYNGVFPGNGDISLNPLFNLAPIRTIWNTTQSGLLVDLHLKSLYGRWTPTGWTTDIVHSPCINAGNPTSDSSKELDTNYIRIDMGNYGNTPEASLSGGIIPCPEPICTITIMQI